jgi:DNA-binding protein Fis
MIAAGEPDLFERILNTVLETAFAASGANQTRAAEQLGISRNTLRTQLARLGIIAGRRTDR